MSRAPRARRSLLACAAILASGAAIGAPALRGVVASVEIEHPDGAIRPRPVTDPDQPVLVRVTPLGNNRSRIEYLALVSGVHDLAPYLERADGRPATDLGEIPVTVVTQLPPSHGSDVFGMQTPGFRLSSHYRAAMIVFAVAWLAVPVVALTRRALRRREPAPPTAPAREPTPAELLRDALRDAKQRELTTAERGRLELLLYQTLRADDRPASVATSEELARSIAKLRRDPRTASVVIAVERCLHAGRAAGVAEAVAAIEAHERASGAMA